MHRRFYQLMALTLFISTSQPSIARASSRTTWNFEIGSSVTFEINPEGSDRILFRDQGGEQSVLFTGNLTDVTALPESAPLKRNGIPVNEWLLDPRQFNSEVIAAGIEGKMAFIDSRGTFFKTDVPAPKNILMTIEPFHQYDEDFFHWISLQMQSDKGKADAGATILLRSSDRRVLRVADEYIRQKPKFAEDVIAVPNAGIEIDLDRFSVLRTKNVSPLPKLVEPPRVNSTALDIQCTREFQKLMAKEFPKGIGRYGVPDSIVPPLKKPK